MYKYLYILKIYFISKSSIYKSNNLLLGVTLIILKGLTCLLPPNQGNLPVDLIKGN